MNTSFISKTITYISLINIVAFPVQANDIDPSDLTAVNSFVSGVYSNDGEISVMGGIAGQYSQGNSFLGLIEHKTATKSAGDSHLPQDTRLRYFQVFDVSEGVLPQIGFSVDYMKSWKMSSDNDASVSTDIIALGAIAKAQLTDSISIFPNLAYVQGRAEAGAAPFDMKGYQANLFGSWSISDRGDYLIFQPQYMYLDTQSTDGKSGKADVNTFKVKTGYGAPITHSGKWWLEASHTFTRTSADIAHIGQRLDMIDNDHLFELSLSYYF
ncbi:hypothetical protein [Shewanella sp. UCD-KL12]|uniref:hypothetical protein n=1 Tax=Shewanella sp. UCD-KL12 TaxID=1917163 RepID=UPI0009712D85|nr:hypothetical protein [Shewanella sp. UCD-KL12]